MELTNREWKEFLIGNLFNIYSTSSGIDKNKLTGETGEYPYITRTEKNNGYDFFIAVQPKYKVDKANVITIGLDTQTVFYQKSRFYTGQNIQILEFDELNEYNAKFIISLLKIQMTKFNWGGNGATLTRLRKTKIMLPVNSERKPDYAFMENYMKQKESELLKKYEEHISLKTKSLKQEKLESDILWKTFELGSIFTIENCKCSNISLLKNGTIPYIGATNRNNGVLKFVDADRKLITKGNCIAFICDGEGSVGYSIYKNEDFVGSTTVKVGRNKHLNKYNAFFITTIADTVRSKYNFGFKRNETHLKKERVLLPTTSNGEPDFEYMENYVKLLKYKKLKQYLDYKKQNVTE
ncbi:restriction endonuclease subunit S [Flavobacterium psychrophilum]|nr:restriction endonuclease subunit S [Flavobacterium psychrophilum]